MKKFTRLVMVPLLAVAVSFSSCSKDDPTPVPQSTATWSLTLPEGADDGTLSDVKASFKNVNTGVAYTEATVTYTGAKAAAATAVTLSVTVPEGLYHVSVEGTLKYTLNGQEVTSAVRAYQESVTITGETASLSAAPLAFYSPSTGFVIEEIFFTGTLTPSGDQYGNDQYIKIYNNSSEVLYADGLAILESAFMTVDKQDYTPNLMGEAFSVDFVFVIPGSGTDHPVQPGKSLLLALAGIDHRTANTNSFDLSVADFEFYDESPNPDHLDVDNPAVPNLDKWYSYTQSYTGLHNRGFHSYAIAKMNVDKETFLKDYAYTAEYTFVFNEYSFPMSTDAYFVPNSWIVDAVNLSVESSFEWLVTDPSLDAGWTYCGKIDSDRTRYGKSVRRVKESTTADGRVVLKDTNNSAVDFQAEATPSLSE